MKNKLLLIFEEGRFGGPHKRILNQINFLKNNFDINVVIPKGSSEILIKELINLKINYDELPITVPRKNIFSIFFYFLFFIYEILYLTYFFLNKKNHLILLCGSPIHIKSIISAYLVNSKIIWEINDSTCNIFIRFIFSKIVNLCDGVIYSSLKSKNHYSSNNFSKSSTIIQSSINCEDFNPVKLSKKKSIFSKESLILGTVCNISKVKNIELMIEIFDIVRLKVSNCKLVVVGKVFKNQQNYFNHLENLIKKKDIHDDVIFVGERYDIFNYHSGFDIYMCTSNSESSPLSVFEAMSMNRLICSTDVGDLSRYLGFDDYSYIDKNFNKDKMANWILKKLKNYDKKKVFSKNTNRLIAMKYFSSYAISKQYIQFLSKYF